VRVAVADIGTNSTRLLIADVGDGGRVHEVDRRSVVTRLGEGVDASGRLGDAAQARVLAALDDYARAIDAHGCDVRVAVLTSAVRDAANGPEFTALVRDRYGFDARTLSGDEEARLTYLGATAGRSRDDVSRVVIDIGGGSTEFVVGHGDEAGFHASVQAGVVRHTERHLAGDPPRPEELEALADDVRGLISDALPAGVRRQPQAAIAVAGTATSAAAIDLALDPYDPHQVEGHRLSLARLGEMLSSLAAKPLAERRQVVGLHPDRAPTIVAGIVILSAALRCFGLDGTEVSEHDILWGVVLDANG
jgi:exopolyphosphatase / guanosine-5'-triphosphate,3'-diphosphate pyrophosphatase